MFQIFNVHLEDSKNIEISQWRER